MYNDDEDVAPVAASQEEAANVVTPKPERKKPVKKASKPKATKKASKPKAAKKAKANGGGIATEFGIREGGERAAVLEALHKPLGRKHTAEELAKLTDSKSTTRVAGIVSRIEKKSAKYRLGYKVVREKAEDGTRSYALHK